MIFAYKIDLTTKTEQIIVRTSKARTIQKACKIDYEITI